MSWWDLCLRLHIIPRNFVKPVLFVRCFAYLSSGVGERTVLARLARLIFIGCPIYGHLHAARHYGDSICSPSHATPLFATIKSALSTTSATVSAEKNGVKSCPELTVWYYNRRRHGLPVRDRFESQQLIRWPSREAGTSIIKMCIKDIANRTRKKNARSWMDLIFRAKSSPINDSSMAEHKWMKN